VQHGKEQTTDLDRSALAGWTVRSQSVQYFENRMWDKQKRERTFNSIIEYSIIV